MILAAARCTHKDGKQRILWQQNPVSCQSTPSLPSLPRTPRLTHPPLWLNCSLRDDRGEAAVAAVAGGRGGAGPEGRHTMERAADQRSGEIELEIFHGWLA